MSLLDYIDLEDREGVRVDLQLDGYRHLTVLDGLLGFEVRVSKRARPAGHGIIPLSRFDDEHPLIATAEFIGDTLDRAWQEYRAVTAALTGAKNTDRLLRYGIGGLELQRLVRCERMTPAIQVDSTKVASAFTLSSPDPRAYSQTETQTSDNTLSSGGGGFVYPYTYPYTYEPLAGGSVAAVNNGNADAPAVITLGGYLLDPIVRLGARTIVFDGELQAGDQLIIDLGEREVTLNGSPDVSLLDFAQTTWFELPPGSNTIELLAGDFDANASITVALRDAYQ